MTTTLIVPGLNDSPPTHWQSWFEEVLVDTVRVNQRDFGLPDLDLWAKTIASAIDTCRRPPIVVAHSFGVLATVRAAQLAAKPIAAALLVAPADPQTFGYADQLPRSPLPFRSTLIASRTDPWISFDSAATWADRWDAQLVDHGNAGHINVDSGHGPWPAGLRSYRELEQSKQVVLSAL